jgi:DnaJ-class molecular chaperone
MTLCARPLSEDIVLEERIDRNGTKHQVVQTNCDRCGGYGGSRAWMFTGVTCYKCGGHGRMIASRND